MKKLDNRKLYILTISCAPCMISTCCACCNTCSFVCTHCTHTQADNFACHSRSQIQSVLSFSAISFCLVMPLVKTPSEGSKMTFYSCPEPYPSPNDVFQGRDSPNCYQDYVTRMSTTLLTFSQVFSSFS
jgi:hypothetical protein